MLHNNKTDWPHFWDSLNASLTTNIKLKSKEDIISAVELFNILVQPAA